MISSTYPSILDAIGCTPLVGLQRIGKALPGKVLLKIEYYNPGLSVKDRTAREIIEDAEARGDLEPGATVIELTSGNAGTGLAVVCAVKGYRLICVMSAGNSPERARMMRAFGAEVVLVPQVGGPRPGQVSGADLEEVERVTQELTVKHNAFRADQFNNLSNKKAHLKTGAEIWQQTNGKLTGFVSIAGSGGSFSGISEFLKEKNPAIKCYLAEPSGAAFLAGKQVSNPNHQIQGVGYARELSLINKRNVDEYLTVNDNEAIETARLLAKKEGIFGGFSTGANVALALQLAAQAKPDEIIVTIACDSGLKYLSTDLYE